MVDMCKENYPHSPLPLTTLTAPIIFFPIWSNETQWGKMFKMGSGVRNLGLNSYYAIYYTASDKVYNLTETQFPPM